MSTFLTELCGEQSNSSDEEIEIRELFNRHWKLLKSQMIMTIINIETWRHEHVKAIDRYAEEQKSIVQADYDRQQRDFNEKYEETRDIAGAYHTAQQLDLFNQLRNECRLLEFQVAQLENVQAEMKIPKVITVEEQQQRRKQEKLRMCQPKNDKEETPATEDSRHTNGDIDSSAKSTLSISIVTKRQLSTTESSSDYDRSKDSKHNPKARVINDDDDTFNKCPVCYMIFPLSMAHDDRSQHVDEHYADD